MGPSRKIPPTPSVGSHPAGYADSGPGFVESALGMVSDAVRGIGKPTRPADADPRINSDTSDLPAAGAEAIKLRKAKRYDPVADADALSK